MIKPSNFFLIIILFVNSLFAQDESSKLQFESVSISPLSIFFGSTSGVGIHLDLNLNINKHLIKTTALNGYEIDVLGKSESFYEIDILYGRSIFNKKKFYIDVFGGIGYFNFKYPTRTIDHENIYLKTSTIGFPLQSIFRIQTGRIFSLGLQLHTNINSANSIVNTSFVLQWKL